MATKILSYLQYCISFSLKRYASFLRSSDGNIAILFSLLSVPLIGIAGLCIDYGQILVARHSAQTGADAAALYASGVAKNLIQNSDGSTASVAAAQAEAQTRGMDLFNAHIAKTVSSSVSGSLLVTKNGQRIDSIASYNISTLTYFGRLFGLTNFTASVIAKSSASMPPYTNLYMALDVSQSMGLASTSDGAKSLFGIVASMERMAGNKGSNVGCVFGCHVIQNGSYIPISYQQVAINANIPLRIDVLRNAVITTINTAKMDSSVLGTSNYKIALYAMGLASSNSTTWSLTQISPLTSNWPTLSTAASNITLGPNNGGGTGDSFLSEPLSSLRGQIPAGGDGNTQNQARTFLFIITDGLRDVKGSCTSGHCTAAFDPASCTSFKNANITVAVIYTTYLPILANPTNGSTSLDGNYVDLVKPYASSIAPNLKSCASPGWYVEASDGPAIDKALADMFAQTAQQPALTY
ncbi:hypothetical protein G3T14_23430 [Methylobacterium sp. BTF04]|uniref:TadE/TadG family type IV pilus assembly protein n=1 Tax=Methylobacterium sp. BTF04 TaxID=2708300 RepID=UPI0013D0C73C|nr:Tad domain-containing protein [Methylobacterium sp. BTF04]NEU14999.1 hypothetical protein [Methylobacterium sp. BTF04]